MAWATIRRATVEDDERLEAAAARFLKNHADDTISYYGATVGKEWEFNRDCGVSAISFIENLCSYTYGADFNERADITRWRKLWRAAVRRALREPGADGIAYDYVGYEAR